MDIIASHLYSGKDPGITPFSNHTALQLQLQLQHWRPLTPASVNIPLPVADQWLLRSTTQTLTSILNSTTTTSVPDHDLITRPANATEETVELYMGPVEAAIATIIWCIILLTASVGNIMVIVAIFTHPALYIVQNFLLVSLALADILISATADYVYQLVNHIAKSSTSEDLD